MIRFSCKWCSKRYKVDDRFAGRSNYCRKCGNPVWIPLPHLHFTCRKCGKHYRTALRYQGMTLPCRGCGAKVTAPIEPAAFQAQSARKEPDYTPFELTVDNDPAPEQAGEASKAPFELVGEGELPPEAELILDVNKLPKPPAPEPPVDAPTGTPIALADTANESLELPLAELMDTPLNPKQPSPPSTDEPLGIDTGESKSSSAKSAPVAKKAVPSDSLPIAKKIPPNDKTPVAKKAGCPRCGEGAVFSVEGRSRQTIVTMIAAGLLGLISAALIDISWIFAGVTLVCFGVSAAASMRKSWTMVCAKCQHSYPA